MRIFDRILGHRPAPTSGTQGRGTSRPPSGFASDPPPAEQFTDEQAVERYRYLLRTAPPEAIERAHAEAFDQHTPAQRRLVLESLNNDLPPQEHSERDDPRSLARLATRAELRRPGTLERTFGGTQPGGMGVGLGGLMGSSFLTTIAAVVIGTAIADAIFSDGGDDQGSANDTESSEDDQDADEADTGYDSGDTGYDTTGDIGGDFGGTDFGGGEF